MRNKGFGLPSFFKTPRYQRFDYVPRYFDPDKEELEMRIKTITQEFDDEDDKIANTKANIRYNYRQLRSQNPKIKSRANFRLLFIILLLSAIAWWMFFS